MNDTYTMWVKYTEAGEWQRQSQYWVKHLNAFKISQELWDRYGARSIICTQMGELMSFTSGTPIEELRKVQVMEQHNDMREEYADVRK